jgi:hypothetical protein
MRRGNGGRERTKSSYASRRYPLDQQGPRGQKFQGGRRLLALPGRQGTCCLLAKAQISKDGARKGTLARTVSQLPLRSRGS